MAMSMGGGGASAPQMNVTPLIDVLLVLIIIFMVIVVSERKEGFKAEIPQPPANPDSAPAITRSTSVPRQANVSSIAASAPVKPTALTPLAVSAATISLVTR